MYMKSGGSQTGPTVQTAQPMPVSAVVLPTNNGWHRRWLKTQKMLKFVEGLTFTWRADEDQGRRK